MSIGFIHNIPFRRAMIHAAFRAAKTGDTQRAVMRYGILMGKILPIAISASRFNDFGTWSRDKRAAYVDDRFSRSIGIPTIDAVLNSRKKRQRWPGVGEV